MTTPANLAFDKTWHSPSSSAHDYVRYIGQVNGIDHELWVEPALRKGGYALHNGSKGGYAKVVQRAGEGYDSWVGVCFRE